MLLCALSLGVVASASHGGVTFQEDAEAAPSSHSVAFDVDVRRSVRDGHSHLAGADSPAAPSSVTTPSADRSEPNRPPRTRLTTAAASDAGLAAAFGVVTGGTPLAPLATALDRSHLLRLSLAGDLRASFRLLEHPELLGGSEVSELVRGANFVPGREHQQRRLALYRRLIAQADSAETLTTFAVLEHIRADLRSGWLDPSAALAVLLEIEVAHGDVALGRRALLDRALLIAGEGSGVARFEGAAARLFAKLLTAPEADIARAAGDGLWRLQHLRAGSTVPDLCGNDPDGNELCIHDFRGRVLLVRFWSNADGDFTARTACDADFVERFWDHPFALIGINRDADRERYLREREEYGFAGNQIYEGPLDDDLVEEVRVRRSQRPNAFESWRESRTGGSYLIDSRGVIRALNPRQDRLPALIAELIGEHYRETRARGF